MNGMKKIKRRDFLKLSLISLASLAFRTEYSRTTNRFPAKLARVTIDEIDVYRQPDDESGIIGKRYLDQLVTIYDTLTPEKGPAYNPVWYRVWGGYVHSAYLQIVKTQMNPIQETIAETGELFEISVPFSPAFTYSSWNGWQLFHHLYYETTHWVTGIQNGPDNRLWYRITSELDKYLSYYIPAAHMRKITDDEITPISPKIAFENKKVIVELAKQRIYAYEGNTLVFETSISSGLPSREDIPAGTRTTRGQFNISSKSPSKHMGEVRASGAPGAFSLPGVPWTSFFVFEYGVAFHGTFWHNNFGVPMSHGCINMRNPDAKWLFRWVTPEWEIPVKDPAMWDRRGFGTQVEVV